MISGVVVPCAGLGTRLEPLRAGTPKEMLPLGGLPLVHWALREIEATGVDDVVWTIGPGKEPLRDYVEAAAPRRLRMRFAIQAEPTGVGAAVRLGRALLGPGRFAVLYPDYVQLPGHAGLCAVLAVSEGCAIGLVRMDAGRALRLGRTARAIVTDDRRVERLEAAAPEPGAWHTCFAEIRETDPPANDAHVLDAWNEIAAAGRLCGVEIPGEVLDVGTIAGYEDARRRMG